MLIHAHSPELEPNSYYNAGLELGALRGCSSAGFDLVTRAIHPQDPDRFRLLSSILDRERPVGIILSPPLSDDIEFIETARRHGAHVVAVSAGERARGAVSAVGIDERAGGHAIGRHLTCLGHRDIGFIKGPSEHQAATLRYDGFLDALHEAGIREARWTATGDFTFKSGVEATEQLLRAAAGVTAVACANDDMAAGVMLALHRAGFEIPRRMSVTGFDDTPMSEIVWPPLTTVRQPIKDLAEHAVHLLADSRSSGAVRFEPLPFELIVRESTTAPSRPAPA
jgi:LacI family transcriptional regulator